MVAPFSKFYSKFWVGFCHNTGKRIFLEIKRAQILLKNCTRDFQNSSLFERSACFYVTISGKFERFQYFNFETDFLENENLFKKTRVPFFQLKSTKLESASSSNKITVSEVNVKTNRMVSKKWTYNGMEHKVRSFDSNFFSFLEILFKLKNFL